MGLNGPVPSLIVFGELPSFPAPSTTNRNQMERFNAFTLARAEKETILAQKNKNGNQEQLPPVTKYLIRPGDNERVCREQLKRWDGSLKVTKVSDKIISLTNEQMVNPFNINAILPIAATTNDTDLKQYIKCKDTT